MNTYAVANRKGGVDRRGRTLGEAWASSHGDSEGAAL